MSKYFINCFLLTIPILIWNILLADKLPKAFQPEIVRNDIPDFLIYAENISRTIMFVLIFLMPLRISTKAQKRGVVLYIVGTMVYFVSWLILIYFPNTLWSHSVSGLLSPAYTPLFWLIGIGLIGNSFYFNLPYNRWFFIFIAIIFLLFHNAHTYLIYFAKY